MQWHIEQEKAVHNCDPEEIAARAEKVAQRELASLRSQQERVAELGEDRNSLLSPSSGWFPKLSKKELSLVQTPQQALQDATTGSQAHVEHGFEDRSAFSSYEPRAGRPLLEDLGSSETRP